jgi:hypothetical protein
MRLSPVIWIPSASPERAMLPCAFALSDSNGQDRHVETLVSLGFTGFKNFSLLPTTWKVASGPFAGARLGDGGAHAGTRVRAASHRKSGAPVRQPAQHFSREAIRSDGCWPAPALRVGDDTHRTPGRRRCFDRRELPRDRACPDRSRRADRCRSSRTVVADRFQPHGSQHRRPPAKSWLHPGAREGLVPSHRHST